MKNKVKNIVIAMFLVLTQIICLPMTAYAVDESVSEINQYQSVDTQVSATVDKVSSGTYSVIIPESLDAGVLNSNEDNVIEYNISVNFYESENSSVKTYSTNSIDTSVHITSQTNGELTLDGDKDETIPFINTLGDVEIFENETIVSSIQIDAKDVANAKSGNYTGTVTFDFTYKENTNVEDEETTESTTSESTTTTTTQPTTTQPSTTETTTESTTTETTTKPTTTESTTTETTTKPTTTESTQVVTTTQPSTTAATTTTTTTTTPTTETTTSAPTTTEVETTQATTEPTLGLADGTYTADVSMMKFYDITDYSMCDKLFAKSADIIVSGDFATITLYVIDPIPNFSSYGTPVSDVWFEYDNTTYSASISTGQDDKYFVADGAFISDDGYYPTSSITVVVPKQSLLDSSDGTLVCSAYVDAVMMSRQEFFVILTLDDVDVDTDSDSGNDSTTTTTAPTTTTTTTTTAATTTQTTSSSTTTTSSNSSSSSSATTTTNSSSSNSSNSSSTTTLNDGTYTADVSMMKYFDITDYSMCDKLFYSSADITVSGDNATLKLYVIDPIPNFSSYGTPVSDVWFEYNGDTYNATVTSSSGEKYFDADGSFISDDGYYTTSVITVTLPKQAIIDAANGGLVCSPYVAAVMMSREQFYVILEIDGYTSADTSGSSSSNSSSSNSSSSSDSNVTGNDNADEVLTQDGNYTAAIEMRKLASINDLSMCSPLFHERADISVVDGMATITLYLINPIPNYLDYGTPLLDIIFEYDGIQYEGVLDESLVYTRYFNYAAGFIDEAGYYDCSPITVTLPVEAIYNTTDGDLTCTGYVNVIMNSTQSFYVFLTDFIEGTTGDEEPETNTNTNTDSTTDSSTDETVQDSLSSNTADGVVTLYAQSKYIGYIIALTIVSVSSLGGYFAYVYYRRKK